MRFAPPARRCCAMIITKAACLLVLASSSLPAVTEAHALWSSREPCRREPAAAIKARAGGEAGVASRVSGVEAVRLLAAYDYELSVLGDGSREWLQPCRIGPEIPESQISNVSVHRHPWLGTVITICFLLGIVVAIIMFSG